MKRAILFLALGAVVLGGTRAWAQAGGAAPEAPGETRSKAFKPDQTLGSPPAYALQDVTVLLVREAPDGGSLRKVTYSGTGKTVYVSVKEGKTSGEKANACTLNDIFAVLQEIYTAGFFRMAPDYTRTLSVEEDPPGEIAAYTTELRGPYPKLSLTVRIGAYAKTVTAVDRGQDAERYGTPPDLIDLADTILGRPEVAAIIKEVGQ